MLHESHLTSPITFNSPIKIFGLASTHFLNTYNMAAQLGGLLQLDDDRFLYDQACDRAKAEWSTALFWTRILQEQFPPGDGYSLAPETPPIEESRKRVDMGVCAIKFKEMHSLLFVEWKRAASDAPGGRSAAEEQVLEYCRLYLNKNRNKPFMHAMVCTGPHATIWKVHQNPKTAGQEEDEDEDMEQDESHAYIDARTPTPNALSQGLEQVRRSKPVSHQAGPPHVIIRT